MAYDDQLVQRIRQSLAGHEGISEKKMFGGVAFLCHGLMFAGVSGSALMARVGKPLYADSLAREHVRPMDFTGKPMAGYVYIDAPGINTTRRLGFWLRRCEDFVATLPPKVARPARKTAEEPIPTSAADPR